MRKTHTLTCICATLVAVSGCASAGPGPGSSDQLRNTIYATHRMVQDLDASLSGSVESLSETTADLNARLDASDQELRQLSSLAQENQRRLERLQASLDSLTTTLYRHFNLSAPSSSQSFPPQSDFERGGVSVQPPSGRFPPPATRPDTQQGTGAPPGGIQTAPRQPTTSVTPPSTGFSQEPSTGVSPTPGVDEVSHYRAAQQLYARQDYQAALQKFDEHLTLFPNSQYAANATYWRAHCNFKLGNYQQAIEGFDGLRLNYPTSEKVPTAMHNQAVAYSRLGQNTRAIELFQRLIREYPDDPATEGAREKLRQLQGAN